MVTTTITVYLKYIVPGGCGDVSGRGEQTSFTGYLDPYWRWSDSSVSSSVLSTVLAVSRTVHCTCNGDHSTYITVVLQASLD